MKLKNNNTNNRQDIVLLLQKQGITDVVAKQLADEYPAEYIHSHIKMLPFRYPKKNPAGLLINAIRGNWATPAQYFQHQKVNAEQQRQDARQLRLEAERQEVERIKSRMSVEERELLKKAAIQRVAVILREKYGDNIPPILINSFMNQIIREKYLHPPDATTISEKKR